MADIKNTEVLSNEEVIEDSVIEEVSDVEKESIDNENLNTISEENKNEEPSITQEQFYSILINTTVSRILDGKINCKLGRENLPKNSDPLVMDNESSIWSVTIFVAIMNILKEEEVYNSEEACSIIEGFMELYNKKFMTWRMWKSSVERFIIKSLYARKRNKKISAFNIEVDWENLTNWVRYSLINTNPIREEIITNHLNLR